MNIINNVPKKNVIISWIFFLNKCITSSAWLTDTVKKWQEGRERETGKDMQVGLELRPYSTWLPAQRTELNQLSALN